MTKVKRVVVTGIGAVTPLGCGIEFIWKRLLDGYCGISSLDIQINEDIPIKVLAKVPRGKNVYEFDSEKAFGHSLGKEHSSFIQYAMLASDLALINANLMDRNDPCKISHSLNQLKFGVAIASGGIGSLQDIVESSRNLEKSYKKISPYFISKILTNMAAGNVSIRHGLKGPLHSVATACAAGAHAVGDAYNFIRLGYADAMLAGGTESSIDPLSIAGFARMRALTKSSDPLSASRPFDSQRDGFVLGEGSCVLVLEELSHALRRNAPIIAELSGYGLSGDAHHITAPDGQGAQRCMRSALEDAGLAPRDISYINAHATSTPIGDAQEAAAIDAVFGPDNPTQSEKPRCHPLYVSSTKGATGHLLGAAGALEAGFAALAVHHAALPPTLNLTTALPATFTHISKTINIMDKTQCNHALTNSFGFGGTNASLIFSRYTMT